MTTQSVPSVKKKCKCSQTQSDAQLLALRRHMTRLTKANHILERAIVIREMELLRAIIRAKQEANADFDEAVAFTRNTHPDYHSSEDEYESENEEDSKKD